MYGDDSTWHSLNANNKGGQNRDAILTTAFAQNQRDEVRNLNDCAGALAAEPGMKQQTFVASFMGGQGSKAGGLGYHEEVSPSIKSEANGTNTVPDVVHSVHQNASGEVRESDVSYTVGTNQNASGRNTPLICETKGF